ncbi:MAG TPA: hypothetical protein VIY52_16650 [Streptosporangiaceae bacterium]
MPATPTPAYGGSPASAATTRAVAPAGAPDSAGHHSAAPQPTATAAATRPSAGRTRHGPAPTAIPATKGRNHRPKAAPRPSTAAVTAQTISQASTEPPERRRPKDGWCGAGRGRGGLPETRSSPSR